MIIVWIFLAFIIMGFVLAMMLMSTVIGGLISIISKTLKYIGSKITGERTITVVVKKKK